MYANAKMRPDETVPGMGRGKIKDVVEGMNPSMIFLINCKNFFQ
jgi:hypothetical protein